MIIYSHTLSPRLQYVVDFLSQYYNTPIKLLCDEEKYLVHPDPHRINYSYHRLQEGEVWIHSHVLLFESTIRPVKIECFEHNRHKAFFRAEGDTGFDLFAGIFFLLTRYEEYLPHPKDIYGRYDHRASLAFKENFLHLPLVNLWLENFRQLLQERFPDLKLPLPTFHYKATYDIDIAWSYKNKGFQRNAGAIVKLFFTGKWRSMLHRFRVIRGRRQDPFDAYEWMDDLHRQTGLKPLYFFLVAQQRSRYDRNIDVQNPAFQDLVRDVASKYAVGLHPSWASGDQQPLLAKEKSWLENISGQPVTASRQHFLRFDLPNTYRRLIAAGITDEYSMGYGTINGFRASVATPYYWFDLKNESKTALRIHPFCFMDANAYYEEKISHTDAFQEMMQFYEVIRSVNGTMITVWHNSFLGIDPAFEGWRDVYEQFNLRISE
ncbi:MAG TPA: polysaccharide deacetylase family protein [Flavisolibacter sp.]|nr:polysaccharide deacetylase family protein [Flavisolibacter sp.]